MNIPDKTTCLSLMDRYEMLPNIKDHSLMVSNVAVFLGKKLMEKGFDLNIQLIEASALLHDITKTISFKTKEDHAYTGGLLLDKLGYHRVAFIVQQHVFLNNWDVNKNIAEEHIVNYSDKRVMHDKIVTLHKRFDDLKIRYGKTQEKLERIDKMFRKTIELETGIFCLLPFEPDRILDLA